MNRLPASTGWLWLKQGFALFRKQPGLLTMLMFANVLAALLMMPLQPVGGIVFTLLLPAVNMITFETCRALATGAPLTPAALFSGFHKGNLAPLARLGLVYLGISIVMGLLLKLGIDETLVRKAYETAQKTKQPMLLPAGQIYTFIGIVFALLLMMLTLWFAPALIHWKKMKTFKAIFYSVFAVFGSVGPMLVMFGAWFMIWFSIMLFGIAIVGGNSIGVVALTWIHLIMIATLQCSLYMAYRHLLPDTD
jgi:hypothetical protein